MAQKEPSLVQNNLLASRLVSLNSDLLEAARPNSKLYNIAFLPLADKSQALLASELVSPSEQG